MEAETSSTNLALTLLLAVVILIGVGLFAYALVMRFSAEVTQALGSFVAVRWR